jgi:putative intracellular protease/amidase
MPANILFVLSSQADLGKPDTVTGVWLEELATPYYRLREAGSQVTLASIKGGAAPIDPMSANEPWLTPDGERFRADAVAQAAVKDTVQLSKVVADDFDGVYFVGGMAAVWDFPGDRDVARLLAEMSGQEKLVAAVCHGVCALLNEVDGRAFAHGRKLTVISDQEDTLAGVHTIVPFLSESRLREAGAEIAVGAPFASHVVSDGRVITGQNPASSAALSELMIAALATKAAPVGGV